MARKSSPDSSAPHPGFEAMLQLANPPFNDSDGFRRDDDARWQLAALFGLNLNH